MSSPSSKTPITSFPEYLRHVDATLALLRRTGEAARIEIRAEARSALRGLVAGLVEFQDGSELHFREFVDVGEPQPRRMYAYHYQNRDKALLFRYDDASHRPLVPGLEHKHTPSAVVAARCPGLQRVVDEILSAMPAPTWDP